MKEIQILVFALLTVCYVVGRPVEPGKEEKSVLYAVGSRIMRSEPAKEMTDYLSTYGYNGYYTVVKGVTKLDKAIRKLQYFAGLEVTGKWDEETQNLMQIPRCGKKDPFVSDEAIRTRNRRYNKQGTMWNKNTLTWRYEHNPARNQIKEYNLKENDIREVFRKAMSMWVKHTNIEFVEDNISTDVDIVMKFEAYSHGDPFPFDGYGGTLAHAFFPLNNLGFSGDVHFDDDEQYSIGGGGVETRDLLWVTTHELGHSLGLDHSREKTAIMYPWYSGYKPNVALDSDDIRGIQMIYGGKIEKKIKKMKCPRSDMTAMWYSQSSQSYMFLTKNQNTYRASLKGDIQEGPRESKFKDKITDSVDSVFQSTKVKEGKKEYNVIFAKDKYYIYKEHSYISGPHSIDVGYSDEGNCNFPPNKIDAVMKWWRNNKVYFFSGEDYWKFDENTNKIDCKKYPRKIAVHFRGLPATIDSAYSSATHKKTYFIAGKEIYLLDDMLVRVATGYPKKLRDEMFNDCE